VRSCAVAMKMSVDECLGMMVAVGNQVSVSATRSDLVFQAHTLTPILSHGWSQIPALDCVWCLCASGVRLFMDKHLGARWGQGCSIKIERPVHVRVCA
jgi:hypothetical protein